MELVIFDKAKQAVAEAVSIDEVRDIRDKSESMRVYYKKAGEGLVLQNQCAQIKLLAERKLGEILSEIGKNKGGQSEHKSYRSLDVTGRIDTLNDLGISKMQSFRYQSIASIPEPIFQNHIDSVMSQNEELTSIGLIKVAKQLKLDERLQNLRNQVVPTDRNSINGENHIYCADCVEFMGKMTENSVDLTITSPPYDNLRDSDGDFNFEGVARGLHRITKEGGVVVWVVGDATINGSETGSSFRQALFFMEIGFNLHDTMIYEKLGGVSYPSQGRYTQIFEYMFVFSKGKPKTFNPICDEPKLWEGSWGTLSTRNKDGSLTARNLDNEGKGSSGRALGSEYGFKQRTNIWKIRNGHGFGSKDDLVILHPSSYPEELIFGHCLTWSNPGDLVFDCMVGSGTTCMVALLNNRNYLGVDINEEYCRIARQRLDMVLTTKNSE